LFFLPPYSPELNPDELVWNDLKSHGTGRKLITPLAQLRQMVVSHMRQWQKLPALVRSFFHAPTTRYARVMATIMGRLIICSRQGWGGTIITGIAAISGVLGRSSIYEISIFHVGSTGSNPVRDATLEQN
jgi:hypothetical protein